MDGIELTWGNAEAIVAMVGKIACSLYTVATVPPPIADLIVGVTGWTFDWKEALTAGRRILTLRQAFNTREGLTPDQFELPKRIASTSKIDYAVLRDGYFSEMKWDPKSGKPWQILASPNSCRICSQLSVISLQRVTRQPWKKEHGEHGIFV